MSLSTTQTWGVPKTPSPWTITRELKAILPSFISRGCLAYPLIRFPLVGEQEGGCFTPALQRWSDAVVSAVALQQEGHGFDPQACSFSARTWHVVSVGSLLVTRLPPTVQEHACYAGDERLWKCSCVIVRIFKLPSTRFKFQPHWIYSWLIQLKQMWY